MVRPDRLTDLRQIVPANGADKWGDLLAERDTARLSWRDADPEDLQGAIVAATEDGAAVLLSKTSDGGALVLHILTGTSRHKLYPASVAELHEALALIARYR